MEVSLVIQILDLADFMTRIYQCHVKEAKSIQYVKRSLLHFCICKQYGFIWCMLK